MTAYPWTTVEQAELLNELVESFLAGRPWSLQQRKDARILVGLLCDHSKLAEIAARVSTLERKLWDDSEVLPA